jgi:hypothetical protein
MRNQNQMQSNHLYNLMRELQVRHEGVWEVAECYLSDWLSVSVSDLLSTCQHQHVEPFLFAIGVFQKSLRELPARLNNCIISFGFKPNRGIEYPSFYRSSDSAAHRSVSHNGTICSTRIAFGPAYIAAGH